MNKIFISGSIGITSLDDQIIRRLNNIMDQQHEILIGDAKGADKTVQNYLYSKQYQKVKVYCSGLNCRNNIGKWSEVKVDVPHSVTGRKFYMVKDNKMAEDADYGFMLWDGKSAGTINNLINLITYHKTGLIYLKSMKLFNTVKDTTTFNQLMNLCSPDDIEKINKKISFRKKLSLLDQPVQMELFTEIEI